MTKPEPSRLVKLFRELKRRRVLTSAGAYVVLAALTIELSGFIFEAFLLPAWASRLVTILFVLGFPVVIVLAWIFDVSASGITRTDTGPAGEAARDRGEQGEREAGTTHPPAGRGGVSGVLKRARAALVPETPLRRRIREARAGSGGRGAQAVPGAASTPVPADPERLRQAVLGHLRHELRTPINGILGYSEMLLEDVQDPDLVVDLERIQEAGRRLLDRVDGLLQPEAVPADALEDLAGFGRQVGLDLRTPITAVIGYAELLAERCAEERRPHLMPDLDRIVAAARRLLEASEDIAGLAAMARGGPTMELPAAEAITRDVLSKIAPVRRGGPTAEGVGRLLVVDDNATNRDLLSRQLARFGYTVATAENGRKALERLDEQEFDLILLDVIMPVLDGVETLRRIQASERHRDTPVVMLSSLDETDSAVRCIEMGAWDFLSKPIQPTLLESRISAALDLRELGRREELYRRRIDADAELLDRLLLAHYPHSLLDRVRAGDLDVEIAWPAAAVVACRLPDGLRPGAGSDGLDRIRRLRDLSGRFEAIAATHGVDALVWRPEGFLAMVGAAEHEADMAAAAALALDTLAGLDGAEPRLAVHVGQVVGGVVGRERPRFEFWGEAVETAEALAAAGTAGSILATSGAVALLGRGFDLDPRGVLEIGRLGTVRVHAVTGRSAAPAATGRDASVSPA